jgi:hypothetical protein
LADGIALPLCFGACSRSVVASHRRDWRRTPDSKLISVAFSKRSVATAARRGMRRNVDSRHNACKGSLRKDSHVHRIDPGEPQPVASGLTSAANPLEPLDALPTAEIEDQLHEGSNVSGDASFRLTGEGPRGSVWRRNAGLIERCLIGDRQRREVTAMYMADYTRSSCSG